MKKTLFQLSILVFTVIIIMLTGCESMGNSRTAELEAQAEQASQNKEVMHEFIKLFRAGNWAEDLPKVIAKDCVLHYPGGRDVVGLDAIMENWKVFFPKLKGLIRISHKLQ